MSVIFMNPKKRFIDQAINHWRASSEEERARTCFCFDLEEIYGKTDNPPRSPEDRNADREHNLHSLKAISPILPRSTPHVREVRGLEELDPTVEQYREHRQEEVYDGAQFETYPHSLYKEVTGHVTELSDSLIRLDAPAAYMHHAAYQAIRSFTVFTAVIAWVDRCQPTGPEDSEQDEGKRIILKTGALYEEMTFAAPHDKTARRQQITDWLIPICNDRISLRSLVTDRPTHPDPLDETVGLKAFQRKNPLGKNTQRITRIGEYARPTYRLSPEDFYRYIGKAIGLEREK